MAKADWIVREELPWRWREAGLAKRAMGDLGKVQLADGLQKATLVTGKGNAQRW